MCQMDTHPVRVAKRRIPVYKVFDTSTKGAICTPFFRCSISKVVGSSRPDEFDRDRGYHAFFNRRIAESYKLTFNFEPIPTVVVRLYIPKGARYARGTTESSVGPLKSVRTETLSEV